MDHYMDIPTPLQNPLLFSQFFSANTSTVTSDLQDASVASSWRYTLSAPLPTSIAIFPRTAPIPSGCSQVQQDQPPQDTQDPVITRVYPSPPLTGSTLKQSVPLPEVHGRAVMDFASLPELEENVSLDDEPRLDSLRLSTLAPHEPLSPPPTLPQTTHELPDVDLGCPPIEQSFGEGSSYHRDGIHSIQTSGIGEANHDEIHSQSDQQQLLTPLSPVVPWDRHSDTSEHSSTAYSPCDHEHNRSYDWNSDHTRMEWSCNNSLLQDDDHASSSSLPKLSPLDPFFPFGSPSTAHDSLSQLPSHTVFPPGDSSMDIDQRFLSPPSSPCPNRLHLPMSDPDSDPLFVDTVMPPDDDDDCLSMDPPSSPSGRRHESLPGLNSFHDTLFPTPIPRSPHSALSLLPDLDMEDPYDAPPAPSSPHLELPSLDEDVDYPSYSSDTISPSLLSDPPPGQSKGLGLFMQPLSVDPPMARSPSPENSMSMFYNMDLYQMDPTVHNLDLDEFIQLRDLHKRSVEAESHARAREASLAERVTRAANALMPSALAEAGELDNPHAIRARKYELQVATDLRAEAHRERKREKQRSREIGSLIELKKNRKVDEEMGFDVSSSLRQLVATMVMKRKEAYRFLANRRTVSSTRPYLNSYLSRSVSTEDLSEEACMEIE